MASTGGSLYIPYSGIKIHSDNDDDEGEKVCRLVVEKSERLRSPAMIRPDLIGILIWSDL